MFKERSTEKLIEYIQTLPEVERKLIASTIVKKGDKDLKATSIRKARLNKYNAMEYFLKKHRGSLTKNFKFDREEANAR
jgi:hypothetical protein